MAQPPRSGTVHPMRSSKAFSIVEVVAVSIVLSMVLVMMVPLLTSGDRAAMDRDAQSSIEDGLSAAQTYWKENGSFSVLAEDLAPLSPTNNFLAPAVASTAADEVSLKLVSGTTIAAASMGSDSGCWFALRRFRALSSEPVAAYAIVFPSAGLACTADEAYTALNEAADGSSWAEPLRIT